MGIDIPVSAPWLHFEPHLIRFLRDDHSLWPPALQRRDELFGLGAPCAPLLDHRDEVTDHGGLTITWPGTENCFSSRSKSGTALASLTMTSRPTTGFDASRTAGIRPRAS